MSLLPKFDMFGARVEDLRTDGTKTVFEGDLADIRRENIESRIRGFSEPRDSDMATKMTLGSCLYFPISLSSALDSTRLERKKRR